MYCETADKNIFCHEEQNILKDVVGHEEQSIDKGVLDFTTIYQLYRGGQLG
jgi:hypothetical protein